MALRNLTRFRQWTGERLGMSSKTETGEEFQKLENEIELKQSLVDGISQQADAYMKMLVKRTKSDKELLIESLGSCMASGGAQLGHDSAYGKSLVKTGEGLQRLGEAQMQYSLKIKTGFMDSLIKIQEELKEYQQLRKKLGSRRLDFDAKMNKVQKSKKERPELEEDMRASQARYEEALADTHNKMVEISEMEDTQHRDLAEFVEAQLEYFRAGVEILEQVQRTLAESTATIGSTVPAARNRRQAAEATAGSEVASDVQSVHSAYTGHSVPLSATASALHSPPRSASNLASQLSTPVKTAVTAVTTSTRKYVEAQYAYDATDPDELSVVKGDIITVLEEIDEGWWVGEITGISGATRRGMFPANYCRPCAAPSAIGSVVSAAVAAPTTPYGGGPGVQRFADAPPSSARVPPTAASIASTSGAPPPRPTGAKPPTVRSTSYSSSLHNGHGGAAASASPQPPASHGYLPSSAVNPAPSATVGPCQTCGCNEYAANVFKKGSCNNCFHKH